MVFQGKVEKCRAQKCDGVCCLATPGAMADACSQGGCDVGLFSRGPSVHRLTYGKADHVLQAQWAKPCSMLWRCLGRITIWSSAASEASPLQRRVRPRPGSSSLGQDALRCPETQIYAMPLKNAKNKRLPLTNRPRIERLGQATDL